VNLLIWGDTETSPALRHEVPADIGDPFLYLESDGRRAVVTSALEEARIERIAPDLERILIDELGRDELIAEGRSWIEIEQELSPRSSRRPDIQRRGPSAPARRPARASITASATGSACMQVHEAPILGLRGREPLIAGDVIAVEPGTVVRGLGGVRVEDLLVLTGDGAVSLTAALPYDLTP